MREIFADPSKLTPAIVLAVVNVAAEPVVSWFKVATLAAATVPEEILLPFNPVILLPAQVIFISKIDCF